MVTPRTGMMMALPLAPEMAAVKQSEPGGDGEAGVGVGGHDQCVGLQREAPWLPRRTQGVPRDFFGAEIVPPLAVQPMALSASMA